MRNKMFQIITKVLIVRIHIAPLDSAHEHHFVCIDNKCLKLFVRSLLLYLRIEEKFSVDNNGFRIRIVIYFSPKNNCDSVQVIPLGCMDTSNFFWRTI